MKELPNFFKNNLIEFSNSEFPVFIDSKSTMLRYGLGNYFDTYNIFSNGFYDYLHKENSRVILSSVRGHDYLIRYFSSITFIHLSFEHLLIELLSEKSEILSKLTLTKEVDLVKILSGKINSIDTSSKKNIDYSIALFRVEELIKNNNELPIEFRIDSKFHFLANHIETLKQLAILRNDIIHSGKKILNRYVYEYFFVNKVLPLVRAYLNIQTPTPFFERNLACKKNVIDEIIRYPLSEKFEDITNFDTLTKTLRRINHFKELGRASYKNPLYMFENVTSEEHRKALEENVNRRKKEEARLNVDFKQETLGHYEVHICPCCGTNALTTFDFWTILVNNRTRVQTAECSVCTYKVNINIGEPKEFGIMDTELFKFLD
ncbi:MAG: hypothetical protein J0L87_11550 [Bacteroidetes bacterium]|nr:hypothetical protein [Bacteroidota bacterium]